MTDPARYFALRLWREYGLSPPATHAELLEIAGARGIQVVIVTELDAPGVYVRSPARAFIILRRVELGRPPLVFAHELFHDLAAGSELLQYVHRYPPCPRTAEERQAHRFAEIVCGDPEEMADWLAETEPEDW